MVETAIGLADRAGIKTELPEDQSPGGSPLEGSLNIDKELDKQVEGS